MSHAGHGGSTNSSLVDGTMYSSFHFSLGETVWFQKWVPQSSGALAGAAIGLFLLAILERWIAVIRAVMEVWWKQRAETIISRQFEPLPSYPHPHAAIVQGDQEVPGSDANSSPVDPSRRLQSLLRDSVSGPWSPSFIISHDLSRGGLHMLHSAIQYALMLAVMTFQGAYFIAIVGGSGVGEFLFGSHGSGSAMH
ncbi:Ctr copper transporter [Auriculariales sp. MPI-PUGE-AT-0066]|nr:Ctr copper transporter [Auriculariales sp. MPI-PUGE-AT-0066]